MHVRNVNVCEHLAMLMLAFSIKYSCAKMQSHRADREQVNFTGSGIGNKVNGKTRLDTNPSRRHKFPLMSGFYECAL